MAARRAAAWTLLLTSLLFATAIALVWTQRRALARSSIVSWLDARGIETLHLDVRSAQADRLALRDLWLRVGETTRFDLQIARIDLSWSPFELVQRRLESLHVEGVRARGLLGSDGLHLTQFSEPMSARPPDAGAMRAPGDAGSPAPDAGWIREVALRDARVTIGTSQGPLEVELSAAGYGVGADRLTAAIEVNSLHPLARGAARLQGDLGLERADGALRFELIDARASERADSEPSRLELRAELDYREGVLSVALPDCIRLRARGLDLAELPVLLESLDLCLAAPGDTALRLARTGASGLQAEAELELKSSPFEGAWGEEGERLRFEGMLPGARLRLRQDDGEPAPRLRVETRGGRLFVPLFEFEARGIELEGELAGEAGLPSGTLRVRSIVNRVREGRYPALALLARFTPQGSALGFELDVTSPKRLLALTGSGSHAPRSGSGKLGFTLAPMVFDPEGEPLKELAPALAETFSEVEGRLSGDGDFAWEGGEVSGLVRVAVEGLGFESTWGSVAGIESRLELAGPFPFHTKTLQRVDVKSFKAGLELTDGIFELLLREDGKVELARMQWGFAKGQLRTSGIYDPLDEAQAFDLRATGIDLESLLAMLELEGLTGSGSLEGVLPLRYDGSALAVRDGRLESTQAGGWIRYRPDASISSLGNQNVGMDMLYAVLENFRYRSIVLILNGDLLGDVEVAMKLSGANPDYQEGRPVEFNLNVEASLGDLVRGGSAFYGLPEKIERKLDERREGK